MLEHLEIANYTLIENLSIDFSEGFNVITGETGSGKSIILGALGLLLGEKADASSIRSGATEMTVNAVFFVPEDNESCLIFQNLGIHPDDRRVLVRRSVKLNGRSSISIQGVSVTRSELSLITESLIDMHCQGEHQSLSSSDKQMKILDAYANNAECLNDCCKFCHNISNIEHELQNLTVQLKENAAKSDYLSFALGEIKNANIQKDEDCILKEKIDVLAKFESIYESTNETIINIKNARNALYDALSCITKAYKCDTALEPFVHRLESQEIESGDISDSLASYLDSVDYSQDAINSMQERLSLLQRLKRKYGPTLDHVICFAEKAEETLSVTENSSKKIEELNKNLSDAKESYKKICTKLSKRREDAAIDLEGKIKAVLRTLGMPGADFSIDVEKSEDRISPNGFDSISFMIAANPGEPKRSIGDIASGGELSRIMLALKTVLAKSDSIDTQVFDEVDVGIGGAVALSLAKCISDLSKSKQVIAVTHLASLASKADCQFVVSKSVNDGRTYTHLKEVTGEDRVREIARMLSGDSLDVSMSHARSMLGII